MPRGRESSSRFIAALVALGVIVAGCTGSGPEPGDLGSADDMELVAELRPFEECEDLRDYFVEHALEMVGPYGLGGGFPGPAEGRMGVDDAAEESAAGADGSVADTAAPVPEAGQDFSETNVQEAGVDEPDLVKTDGQRLVTVREGHLHVIDVTGAEPAEVGRVELPGGAGGELLLHDGLALVLSHGARTLGATTSIAPAGGPTSQVTLVDVSGEPEVVETLAVDGGVVSARLVDGVARVVLRTAPVGLDFVTPEGDGLRAEREATERNREIIRQSEIENWLPYFVRQRGGRAVSEGILLDCDDVHHPESFGGLGLAAVLALDPEGGLEPTGTAAVVGAGDTVYATPDNLYVATQRWAEMGPDIEGARAPEDVTTALHRFSIEDPDEPRHEASGEVPGRLLDQWSLSEHDGHLRVAVTEGDPWGPEEGPDASHSGVRVLDADLEEVGAIDGLGVGERIYAVRYAGDIGYIVTFRQTDPLYTMDLSDPTDPRVLGELKITGYSGYLHPIGDGRLLGVGQAGTEEGQLLGAQLSVFDIDDLSDPRRIDQLTVEDGHTPVEHDHRALLHWPAEDLVVLPMAQHPRGPVEEPAGDAAGPGKPEPPFMGALAVSVGEGGLEELARIEHPGNDDWGVMIERAVVVGDLVYTVSRAGVLATDMGTWQEVAWIGH